MPENRKSRSEQKRESIVNAAKRAFQEVGVQATSMDTIAELADVSKRTVYNHFATKEDLVLHLLAELWERSMLQADVEYRADAPLPEQLKALLRAEIDLVTAADFLGLARVAAGYFLYQPERLKAEMDKLSTVETDLHRWLKAANDDGRLHIPDMTLAIDQLHSLVKGGCYWPQLHGYQSALSESEKERLADETAALFLSRYRVSNPYSRS